MSIRKRTSKKAPDGYSYQVYFSYHDRYTDEKKMFTKSGFYTYEDALYYEKKMKIELDQKHYMCSGQKVTMNQIFNEWLNMEASYYYQDNTIIDYKNRYYKHIEHRLGSVLVNEVDFRLLQNYFNENEQIGMATNYKLKEVLSALFKFSIKCGYISTNPLNYVRISGKDSTRSSQAKVYTDKDFFRIIDELQAINTYRSRVYITALYIGRYTGMRISEVFALDKDDFCFASSTICVNKKMVYANKKQTELKVCNEMKSKTSKSILPFHKDLKTIMSEWFDVHPQKHVISDEDGSYINPKQLEYTLWKISKQLGIHFNYHMLRHTLASRMAEKGADMKAAQEILRHANISTTMNIYTHVNEKNKEKALYKAFPIQRVK